MMPLFLHACVAQAALETNPSLIRRTWDRAFKALDVNGDGVVGDRDLEATLDRLGIETEAQDKPHLQHQKSRKQREDARQTLMHDGGGCTSKELLRLVLLPDADADHKKRKTSSAVAVA